VKRLIYIRLIVFLLGLVVLSLGISITVKVQHLGLHPWDVLSVGLYDKFGLTIGTWGIIIGLALTFVTLFLDRTYVRAGTYINIILVGIFIDFFLWLDFVPETNNLFLDAVIITVGIIIMGIGGGMYNSVRLGAGPRDGFMLVISDKTGYSIRAVRITTESLVLVIGLIIGGPVFVFSFIFTFIQSPVFQFSYEKWTKWLHLMERRYVRKKETAV